MATAVEIQQLREMIALQTTQLDGVTQELTTHGQRRHKLKCDQELG